MVAIKINDNCGTAHELEGEIGQSLMEVSVSNGVPGIDANCGGSCACATCHVYVNNEFFDKLDSPDDVEESMLEFVTDRKGTSRLSCQVILSESIDGIEVDVPESQG